MNTLEALKLSLNSSKKYNNKTYANALVGTVLGTSVLMDDVSPLGHKIPVTLRSKNLTYNCIYNDVALGDTATAVISGIVNFEKGKTYTISFDTENTGAMLALSISTAVATAIDSRYPIVDGTRKSVTLTALVDYVRPQGVTVFQLANSSTANSGLCSNLQIEESPVATEYTPFVPDGTEVTVKSCGKNLLHTNSFTAKDFRNLNTQSKTFSLFEGSITGDFTLSFTDNLGGTSSQQFIVYVLDGVHNGRGKGWGSVFKFSGTLTSVYLSGISNPPSGSLDDIQLEVGTSKTEFEPYKEGETIVTTRSEGAELTNISPNMTIGTDNAGVKVGATYNKDTNIVIEKLTQAIISLGGNI